MFRSPLEKTRYETSLGLLTKKFVSLFHLDPSGTVDLNKETIFILSTSLETQLSWKLNFCYVSQPTKFKNLDMHIHMVLPSSSDNFRQISQGVHELWSLNKRRLLLYRYNPVYKLYIRCTGHWHFRNEYYNVLFIL